jgi:ABC-type dipeptide/oligopeptide/nickel transport system permease component
MSFKNIAIVTAIITFVLGIGYLIFGSVIIGRWQIEPTENVLLLGRRMGSFYLGLSVIFFLSRSIPLSEARRALTIGAVVMLSILTFLSIYEYIADRVGSGILVSAAIELLLALGYVRLLIVERKSIIKVS